MGEQEHRVLWAGLQSLEGPSVFSEPRLQSEDCSLQAVLPGNSGLWGWKGCKPVLGGQRQQGQQCCSFQAQARTQT